MHKRSYTLGAAFVVDDATRAEWGERMRTARKRRTVVGADGKRRAMLQADVASAIGCTRAAVSAWERGINTPAPEVRKAIARVLRVPVSRVFPEPVAA